MVKRNASPYDTMSEQLKLRPRDVASRHQELDKLALALKGFNEDASSHGYSNDEKVRRKTAILNMVRDFDALTPHALEDMYAKGHEVTDKPLHGEIAERVQRLEETQARYRAEADPDRQEEFSAQSDAQVCELGDVINARRELVQPKRPPRIDPTRGKVLKDILPKDVEAYSKFVRAFADSVEEDRRHENDDWALRKLPHINQLADEAIMFKAMLDLSRAINQVVLQCDSEHNPQYYWQGHQTELKNLLGSATERFHNTIRELHPRITAGYRGLATTRSYDEYVKADQAIGAFMAKDRPHYEALLFARETIQNSALELILGGTNEDRSEPHHNFLTRVVMAYRRDRKHVAQEAEARREAHIRSVDRGQTGNTDFSNPLTDHALHTLNRVYEARWALAADRLSEIVGRTPVAGRGENSGHGRYKKAVGDFTIPTATGEHTQRAVTEQEAGPERARERFDKVRAILDGGKGRSTNRPGR